MPPRSQTILRLCEAHQISTVPLPHIAFKAFAYLALHDQAFASLRSSKSCHRYTQQSKPLPYAATQRHCYALQHHAVAVQCLSSPLGAMPLPRDTMRFHAYPLLFEAFRSYSFALVAYLSLRCESCCLAAPLLCRSKPRTATPLPVIAKPSRALALNRALRR